MNILITGASSGIGRQLAINYANKDNILILLGRNTSRLNEIADICKSFGANVIIKSIDICNKSEMKSFLDDLSYNIDIVFANAGISGGMTDGINNDEMVYNIFNTNIFGVLNTIEPIVPKMIKMKNGKIVIISSMASFRGLSSAPAYSASKACIRFYGEALNNYLRKFNVDVNIVCPGFIKTPMTDKNDFLMPFILSPEYAVKKIVNGISKNKKFIIFPKSIYYFIKLINCLPFGLGDYIFSKLPKK